MKSSSNHTNTNRQPAPLANHNLDCHKGELKDCPTMEVVPMLFERPDVECTLTAIVHRLTSEPDLWEELLQEARVHLWQIESRRAGQTRSWYMESCKMHLQNYLRGGRSIDSARHRFGRERLNDEAERQDGKGYHLQPDERLGETLIARDFIKELKRHLSLEQQMVLELKLLGYKALEIGALLELPHGAIKGSGTTSGPGHSIYSGATLKESAPNCLRKGLPLRRVTKSLSTPIVQKSSDQPKIDALGRFAGSRVEWTS